MTCADGTQATWSYDAAGRMITTTQPDGGLWHVTFDGAVGNRLYITRTNPLNGTSVVTNTYDSAGELASSQAATRTATYRSMP